MLLPTLLFLGNWLPFAPVPQSRLNLPAADGRAEWYQAKTGASDVYGDPLPAGAIARIGTARFCHDNFVFAIAFSPDGKTLAAAGHEGIRLWDAVSGKLLAHFTLPNSLGFNQVAFLPRSKYLVSQTQDGRITFWELSPSQKRPFRGPQADVVSHLALAGNGKRLAFSKDGAIRLWEVATGKEVARLEQSDKPSRLAISADGKRLASNSGSSVKLWDVSAGRLLRTFSAPEAGNGLQPAGRPPREQILWRFTLSGDGQLLAALITTEPETFLYVWEAQTGKQLHVQEVTDHTRGPLAFSPDGKLLALAGDKGVWLCEARTREQRRQIRVYDGQTYSLAFSPDGRLLATGHDSVVRLWDVATGREQFPDSVPRDRVGYYSLSADGRTLVTLCFAPNDKGEPAVPVLRFWDAATGKRRPSLWDAKKPLPPFVDLSEDQRTLATWGKEGILQTWAVNTGKELGQITYEGFPEAWSLSYDGKLFVLGTRARQREALGPFRLGLWNVRTGKHLGDIPGIRRFLRDTRFSPDGKLLVFIDGSDHTLHLWDVTTQKELFWFQPKLRQCALVTFSRDGRTLAVAGFNTEIRFVDVPSGKELPRMLATESATKLRAGIFSLHLLPDGKRLIVVDRLRKIFIFERASGRLLKEWQADPTGVRQLVLSADGKVLVTHGANAALVWDLEQLLRKKD
jgi:WD40 repeat protein